MCVCMCARARACARALRSSFHDVCVTVQFCTKAWSLDFDVQLLIMLFLDCLTFHQNAKSSRGRMRLGNVYWKCRYTEREAAGPA